MTSLSVLFVCTANICRSPYMELVARHALGPESTIAVCSAGTHGFIDSPMNPVMAARLHDVDHTEFLSRRLSMDMVDEADLVLTAEGSHRQFILGEHPAAFRKVFSLGQFAEAVRRAETQESGTDLVNAVGSMSGIVQLSLDVADPYARGPRAAAACAEHIDDLLWAVLPALAGATQTLEENQ
jgi:protein-tyrosine-phosphatase